MPYLPEGWPCHYCESSLEPTTCYKGTLYQDCHGCARVIEQKHHSLDGLCHQVAEGLCIKKCYTETIVNCLMEVTARIGVPQELLSDNGSNFMSMVMKKYCNMTGIKQIRTSPCHPQRDGTVERFNATLKRLL